MRFRVVLLFRLARYVWAFPATLLGLFFVPLAWLSGGTARPGQAVHVRQYERWGPLYLAASGVLYLRGLDPYLDNPFERAE